MNHFYLPSIMSFVKPGTQEPEKDSSLVPSASKTTSTSHTLRQFLDNLNLGGINLFSSVSLQRPKAQAASSKQ